LRASSGGRHTLIAQPALEVLYANRMLNLGMLYFNRDRRLTVPDILDPFIVPENPQSLGDRLVDASGAHLDRVFHSSEIEAGNFARLQSCRINTPARPINPPAQGGIEQYYLRLKVQNSGRSAKPREMYPCAW
jgi:hypothetical protein